ncbi:MAG: RtcB family protein [Thermoanaerobaculia bacterium]|nr:RtcB family protein [Thermoanaerobaculia bacterium]
MPQSQPMKRRELLKLGYEGKQLLRDAMVASDAASAAGVKKSVLRRRMQALIDHPQGFFADPQLGDLARSIAEQRVGAELKPVFEARREPAPYRRWGGADIDRNAVEQLENACRLPVSARAALMPDAHLGYGLPIGGVLATRNCVIPYAVGVDIACRMKMTVLDLPVPKLEGHRDRLIQVLERETRFGIGAEFARSHRRQHEVLDDDWSVSPVTKRSKDKAWKQLGTSGSGNHFVEYGILEVHDPPAGPAQPKDDSSRFDLEPGNYVALLSHSGSRGVGAQVASHYSKLAMNRHPELPRELKHLAWLDLDDETGREYWHAMNLMGRYAAANHATIHRHIAKALGLDVLADVENHHNFAWQERHDEETVIVHRKGATPAGAGVLGVIPGDMASPAHVVRGLGSEAALRSASHGAGRVMSRKKAKNSLTWSDAKKQLADRGVTVLSCGLDEVPAVYRDIEDVMAAQTDLVQTLARFHPRIVKMAPAGERPED